jgi:chromosome partitioning protein
LKNQKKIITVANSKGGSGKTTIATNLAVEFAHDGYKILLVDADPQGSSMNFRKVRKSDDIKAIAFIESTLDVDLQGFDFDYIIVDVGGADTGVFRSAMLAADLVLIPTRPSQLDVWETKKTVDTLEKCRMRKDIVGRFVLNQVIPNTNINASTVEALTYFEDKVPLSKNTLGMRVSFEECISFGQGVSEYESKGKARYEIQGLYSEILDILENGKLVKN